MAMRHPAHGGAQGLAAQEPKRRFHAKFFVEGLLRIANQHEWNILLVRPDRLSGGVKDDHLIDARRFDLVSTPAQLGNVRVADRAVHEPPELQMDETVRVGELDRPAGDGFQSCSRNNIAWFEFHVHSLPCCLWHLLHRTDGLSDTLQVAPSTSCTFAIAAPIDPPAANTSARFTPRIDELFTMTSFRRRAELAHLDV